MHVAILNGIRINEYLGTRRYLIWHRYKYLMNNVRSEFAIKCYSGIYLSLYISVIPREAVKSSMSDKKKNSLV